MRASAAAASRRRWKLDPAKPCGQVARSRWSFLAPKLEPGGAGHAP